LTLAGLNLGTQSARAGSRAAGPQGPSERRATHHDSITLRVLALIHDLHVVSDPPWPGEAKALLDPMEIGVSGVPATLKMEIDRVYILQDTMYRNLGCLGRHATDSIATSISLW